MIEKQKNAKETLFHILPQTEIEDIGANGVNEVKSSQSSDIWSLGKLIFKHSFPFPFIPSESYTRYICAVK